MGEEKGNGDQYLCGRFFASNTCHFRHKTGGGAKNKGVGSTLAYLESEGEFDSNISVSGVQLKVYQKSPNSDSYEDVTDTGFDLIYPYFSTDQTYKYDIILRNDETADVTASQYYLRWSFNAIIDNITYDITDYCNIDSAYVYKQTDSDGKTRYYSVNGSTSNVISAQNQIAFLSSIKFKGQYNPTTKKYGSILDQEFSGSKVKITANIEGSLTPYEIIRQTVKIFDNSK